MSDEIKKGLLGIVVDETEVSLKNWLKEEQNNKGEYKKVSQAF